MIDRSVSLRDLINNSTPAHVKAAINVIPWPSVILSMPGFKMIKVPKNANMIAPQRLQPTISPNNITASIVVNIGAVNPSATNSDNVVNERAVKKNK